MKKILIFSALCLVLGLIGATPYQSFQANIQPLNAVPSELKGANEVGSKEQIGSNRMRFRHQRKACKKR